MVRPLSQDHNSLRVKTLKGNAIGLNMVGIRKILTPEAESQTKLFTPFKQRFNYALQPTCWRSELRKNIFNNDSEEKKTADAFTDSVLESKPEGLSLICITDPIVNHKKTRCDTFIQEESQNKQIKRKHRMRDKMGNIICRDRAKNPKTRKAESPKTPKRDAAERLNRFVLNIRCLKIGTLTKIFRSCDTLTTQCMFTVNYIEIANQVRIEASEVTSCEWCTVQRLPSLFLQTTPTASHRLRAQIVYDVYEDDSLAWYDCQSKNQEEKYIALIFERELTLPEQLILEEIFKEIGRSNNICNFPAKLSYEEAYNRLKTHNHAPKQQQASVTLSTSPNATRSEIATLSVSDSDEDLLEIPSLPVHEIKKLVVYPPPPAKGGITITEEDLNCLDEGTFLNDVIVDFYLRFLVCEQLKREDAVDCQVFSSFFFKHLTREDNKRPPGLSIQELRHNRVKTWTRHVNIFEKDFIFVPINQRAHWYLAVICFPGRVSPTSDSDVCVNGHSAEYFCDQTPPNPMSLFYRQGSSDHNTKLCQTIGDLSFGLDSDDDDAATIQAFEHTCINSKSSDSKRPCILIMDSLACRSRSSVVQILQEYLQEEWRVKKGCSQSFGKGVMDGWSPLVPQQDNYTDCGIYLLQYVEKFLKDPPQTFYPSMDLNDWFSQKTVKKKRQQIKQLILKLHREQTV
ncbi:sentrin-specific protease 6 isoform X2 [Triplophysa dalaica]|uniref:sentrin-specific protease 6 isoform X2 n=1 Tax=Triplophysa dalaica TaxID=1582913 RepID=UPI0024DFA76A|nr:sentrin-specific protease 6 isoform X2 [Triplophysa dalaica]